MITEIFNVRSYSGKKANPTRFPDQFVTKVRQKLLEQRIKMVTAGSNIQVDLEKSNRARKP